MTKIYTPSAGPRDWKALLADPEKHWARGYSARSLAHCWEDTHGFPLPDNIFYQLLHRTASAVIEAERFGAVQAVMLVHSFSPSNRWFVEYKAFAGLFGVTAEVGRLSTVRAKDNMPLHLTWVHGDERFLSA